MKSLCLFIIMLGMISTCQNTYEAKEELKDINRKMELRR